MRHPLMRCNWLHAPTKEPAADK